jgi:phytoene dehydrogenase-like protein
MAAQYDVAIIGAGHNGLVAATYLARAGLRVVLLERRHLVGGACATEELFPGFRLSSCSYICHLLQERVITDLQLGKHGFEVYTLAPNRFHPFPDGRYLVTWDVHAQTAAEIARYSTHDARAYLDWMAFWERAGRLLHAYFLTPPPTYAEIMARVRGTEDEALLETLLTRSMLDLVEEYFETDMVRAHTLSVQDIGDPRAPGSPLCYAYIKVNLCSAPGTVGIVKGGMGRITQAMAQAARQAGAEIRTGAEVARVLTEAGEARGVILHSGEVIHSRLTVSNADPKRTFFGLVPQEALDPGFVRRVKRLSTQASYLKFHAALRELPDFSRYLGSDFDAHYLAEVKICPSVEYFERSWQDAKEGRPSSCPIMEVQIPSVYDPTLCRPGQHVVSIWVLYAPPHLRTGTWEEQRRAVGEQLIDTLTGYAPNFRRALLDWQLLTPLDLEQRVGLTDGNIRHIDIVPQQMFARRPLPGWAQYRTPVPRLYLCGAGTHPGGEVTGAPGHNAAQAILADWPQWRDMSP